jgi:hypothetical protein
MFDMDLYAPTLYSYNFFRNILNPGDCIYFDEAFDGDERIIIKQHFLREFDYEIIGFSPLSLGFKIINLKGNPK